MSAWFMSGYLIMFTTADGEEREERWKSVEAFRSWAIANDAFYTFTVYHQDEDEEWVVLEKGKVGTPRGGS